MAVMIEQMEIICVGNELLIGKTLNTNAKWIAEQATARGIIVKRVTVVADDVNEIANAIRESLDRKPRFIITTGGLGPTFDDKTLEGIAEGLNRKLALNTEARRMVKEKYESYAMERGTVPVELTYARLKMAKLPEKAKAIPNPVGTAPAAQVELKNTVLIALPGVPSEMKAIFKDTLIPMINQVSGGSSFYEESVYVEGIMESSLAPLTERVMRDNIGVYVKSHPKGRKSNSHIEVHLSTTAKDSETPERKIRDAVIQLTNLLRKVGGTIKSLSD